MVQKIKFAEKPMIFRFPPKTGSMLQEMSDRTGWSRQQILRASAVLLYDQIVEQGIDIEKLTELKERSIC